MAATPDGSRLVFSSRREDGHLHLYRTNADGSGLIQLTRGETEDSSPDCSPDGASVVYTARVGGKPTLWRVSIEGGDPVQLTDYESITPRYSPDGSLISCELPGDERLIKGRLVLIKATGGAPLKTFDLVDYTSPNSNVRWTPDGRALVTVVTRKGVSNLWEQPISGGEPGQLTDFKSDIIYNYTFSQDGRRLIISRGHYGVDVLMIEEFR